MMTTLHSETRTRLRRFAADETGTQSIEVLLIVATVLVPCFFAILLMQEVLWEVVEVTTVVLTSPFF